MHSSLRALPLLVSTLVLFPTSAWSAVPDDPRHRSTRKKNPSAKEIEQEREWMAVDKTSAAALQAYLDKKPKGSRHKEAALLLPVATKLEAVIAGKVKPEVVMPLEPFKKQPKNHAKKLAVAVSYNGKVRVDNEPGACWSYGSIDFEDNGSRTKGVFAVLMYVAYPGNENLAPGSILAFDSGGDRPTIVNPQDSRRHLPVIVTARNSVAYFGLVEDVGWVHLAGEGEVVYADGKSVKFR